MLDLNVLEFDISCHLTCIAALRAATLVVVTGPARPNEGRVLQDWSLNAVTVHDVVYAAVFVTAGKV